MTLTAAFALAASSLLLALPGEAQAAADDRPCVSAAEFDRVASEDSPPLTRRQVADVFDTGPVRSDRSGTRRLPEIHSSYRRCAEWGPEGDVVIWFNREWQFVTYPANDSRIRVFGATDHIEDARGCYEWIYPAHDKWNTRCPS